MIWSKKIVSNAVEADQMCLQAALTPHNPTPNDQSVTFDLDNSEATRVFMRINEECDSLRSPK